MKPLQCIRLLLVFSICSFFLGALVNHSNKKPSNVEQHIATALNHQQNLLQDSNASTDYIQWKGRQTIAWQASYIPEELNRFTPSGLYFWKTGSYLVYSNRQKDTTTTKFAALSRDFSFNNFFTEDIQLQTPFAAVTKEQVYSYQHKIEFQNQVLFVTPHSFTISNWLAIAFYILLSVFVIVVFYIASKINNLLISTILSLAPWAILSYVFPNALLEIFGTIFQPNFYAASIHIPSYAHLMLLLLGCCVLGITFFKNSRFWSSFGLLFVLGMWTSYIFPSLIKDGAPFPEINLPFILSTEGLAFWLAILLICFPIILASYSVLKSFNSTRQNQAIILALIATYIFLCDVIGFVDWLHILWPITAFFLLFVPIKKFPQLKTPLLLVTIALGITFSIHKYYSAKLRTEGQILTEQIASSSDTEIAHYLLREEWQNNQNILRQFTDTAATQSFVESTLLQGFLAHYKAIATVNHPHGVSKTTDSLFVTLNGKSFVLQRKPYFNEVGFPLLLSDVNWQTPEDYKFKYAHYNNGILEQKSRYFPAPKNANFLPEFSRALQKTHWLITNEYDTEFTYVFIQKITWQNHAITFFAALALLLSIQLIARDLPLLLAAGIKIKHRIRFAVMGMCIITAVVLSAMGFQNINTQFEDQNRGFLAESAESIERKISQKEPEVWSGSLLLVQKLNSVLLQVSQAINNDISFYQLNGDLATSTEPLLFSSGMKSTKMSKALLDEISKTATPIWKKENIGGLTFLSYYLPYIGQNGEMLGIINIPLFDKQQLLNQELSNYAAANLNILIFALVLALFLSHFLANAISKPIISLENTLTKAKPTDEIPLAIYANDDEIGALVKAYNQKVKQIKTLLEDVARNERESAWKHMAQQVAHEIKNPLTPIKLKSQWLQAKLPELTETELRERSADLITTILDQTELLKNIANEFSQYAALHKVHPERIDCKNGLENIIRLFANQPNVSISLDAQNAGFIYMDKSHFKRVFTNLLQNAIQAKKEDKPLNINIQASANEKNCTILVTDDGIGIEKEILEKIFQPNFTTKSSGTGLGLAMVKTMLSSASATISVHSEPEKGSRFTLKFSKQQ